MRSATGDGLRASRSRIVCSHHRGVLARLATFWDVKGEQVTSRPVADLLVTLAEPTRLRIVNCLSTAPLFVSDLAAILELPDATVDEHMKVLHTLGIVRAYPVVPYVLFTLALLPGTRERLLRSVLDAVRSDPAAQPDRSAALDRSRSRFETRVRGGAQS
jgi:DNA-binding transcriptional ArsR family regulator